ncbi:spore gernimation protein GerPD [Paenibacillus sp. 19GGS1-52]|uniref:spore gernimation protein GerPD n=1 Tax=Paenibacillus sp. 19GGS1-52 TaxID=2758563 RepID=UPI001EFBDF04|nr:spore gernimation protein GerPD [Paenibacillus sp. 19GGS1-52]
MLVVNKELNVGAVKVVSISGSSVFLVGDSQTIHCSSIVDSTTEQISNDPTQNNVNASDSLVPNKEKDA